MKIESRQLIEIIGIFGVIASLIFVGMQLLLDRRIAIANQYQTRAELRLQAEQSQFQNENYIAVEAARWESQRPPWWDDEVEKIYRESGESMLNIRRDLLAFDNFRIIMDNNIYQYKQGLLEEENWLSFRQSIKNVLQTDSIRSAYLSRTSSLSNLDEMVRELNAEIESGN